MASRRRDLSRPNDYHPDHRYTAILVQDAAFMVIVPSFCPDVPALRKNPVFLYSEDDSRSRIRSSPMSSCRSTRSSTRRWRHRRTRVAVLRVEPLALRLLGRGPQGKQERLAWTRKRAEKALRRRGGPVPRELIERTRR